MNSMINASIENDEIYQIIGWNAQKNKIGVTLKKYNELKEIADGYYNVLVEKGIIEKPKTAEEIAKEQQKIMTDMLNQMKIMQEEIKDLKKSEKNNIEELNIMPIKDNKNDMQENIVLQENKKSDKKLLNFK